MKKMDSLRRNGTYGILNSITLEFEVEQMGASDILQFIKPYTGDNPYIFISYCAADSEIAHDIIEEFRRRNYRVFYVTHPVNEFDEHALPDKIQNCAFFLCVLSEAYTNDPKCIRDMYFAFNNRKTVLPIIIEDFQLPETIKYLLSAIHFLYLSQFESVSQMIDRICEVDDQRLMSCIDRPVRKPERKTGFFERLTGKRK